MEKTNFKIYGYRWIVLLVFMFVVAMNQLLWITFASITGGAAKYYGVSDLSIALLSISFMIVFIIVSIPASWVIDTYGIRIAVGIGAVLTGAFGLLRGIVAQNYNLVLISQIGIAIGQPFILNATTTIAARWFPIHERATASGLGSLAIYLGIIVGLVLTPYLTLQCGIGTMLTIYGIISVISAITFLWLAKERPPTSPSKPGMEVRSLVLEGIKESMHNKEFIFLMVIFFIGLGTFNGVTTWIEDIVRPRGFSITRAGTIGGIMILGGIIGALIIPSFSDHYHKRTPFIILSLVGASFGLVGITYATSYISLLVAAFVLGFSLLSAGPIGFQYGAEIAYPTPEGTSNGLLLLMGQISGVLFIFGMDLFRSPGTGSMTPFLNVLIGLLILSLLLCTRLKESSTLLTQNTNH